MPGDYEEWEQHAVCKQIGTELFFPQFQGTNTYAQAERACRICPVRQECLDKALRDEEPFGMWGGTTPKARLFMLKKIHGPNYFWPVFDDGMDDIAVNEENQSLYCKNNLHRMDADNVWFDRNGYRKCWACKQEMYRRSNRRRRGKPA